LNLTRLPSTSPPLPGLPKPEMQKPSPSVARASGRIACPGCGPFAFPMDHRHNSPSVGMEGNFAGNRGKTRSRPAISSAAHPNLTQIRQPARDAGARKRPWNGPILPRKWLICVLPWKPRPGIPQFPRIQPMPQPVSPGIPREGSRSAPPWRPGRGISGRRWSPRRARPRGRESPRCRPAGRSSGWLPSSGGPRPARSPRPSAPAP